MPLIIVYIILIGPVDYVLSKKCSRRRITWITFPSYVIGFSAIIYIGALYTKQATMTYKHLTVYDAASGSRTARVTKWFSVYPPESRVYQVACRAQFVGLAEGGVTDLALRPVTLYGSDSRASLSVALPQWSSQLLRADGEVEVSEFTAVLLVKGDRAKLTVDGRLPLPLPKADLVYGPWIALLMDVRSGRSYSIAFTKQRRQYVRDHLVRHHRADRIAREVATYKPWLQALFLSLRRECDLAHLPRRPPVFHARLDLTRHVQDGAAYILGTIQGDLPGEEVTVDRRRVGMAPDDSSAVFVRYRVEVRHE